MNTDTWFAELERMFAAAAGKPLSITFIDGETWKVRSVTTHQDPGDASPRGIASGVEAINASEKKRKTFRRSGMQFNYEDVVMVSDEQTGQTVRKSPRE